MMAEQTKIQWTDHTWNPWRGCTKVSEGCKSCYADAQSVRNPKVLGIWGPQGRRVVAAEAYWQEPYRWAKAAQKAGRPARVFCASFADVFEDWRGPMHGVRGEALYHDSGSPPWRELGAGRKVTMDDVRRRVFKTIEETGPWLIYQLVTKRPENMLKMTHDAWCKPVPGHVRQNEGDGRRWQWPDNVWALTSVEDQKSAELRIVELMKAPARVRGLSIEPLLGPVDLSPWFWPYGRTGGAHIHDSLTDYPGEAIRWVIIGGESGPHARPCHLEWIRSLVCQCKDAGVACFVKQLGAQVFDYPGGPELGLVDRKGGDPDEWPTDLRVREFPA